MGIFMNFIGVALNITIRHDKKIGMDRLEMLPSKFSFFNVYFEGAFPLNFIAFIFI